MFLHSFILSFDVFSFLYSLSCTITFSNSSLNMLLAIECSRVQGDAKNTLTSSSPSWYSFVFSFSTSLLINPICSSVYSQTLKRSEERRVGKEYNNRISREH